MEGRKYHLDWLRVLAFALLIPFHAGMLYVTWYYNLKSPRLVPQLEWGMMLLTPWRMALVFFISGVASRQLIAKLGPGRFSRDRLRRLLPVILFGMLVVVPPQTWIELTAKGLTHARYLDFWWSYLRDDQSLLKPPGKVMPRWDHLWFLLYLLPYTMLFALAWKLRRARHGSGMGLPWLLVAPALWLVATGMIVDRIAPRTDALFNDWGQHLKWAGMFAAGVAAAMRADVWRWLEARRVVLLGLSALLGAAMLADHALWLRGAIAAPWDWISYDAVSGLFGWSVIVTVLGYATRYLSRPSGVLAYLNAAILPVYVLHQPILLLTAYVVFPLRLPLPLEAASLIAATLFGALAIYHFAIRPFAVMRFFFGLKAKERAALA